MFQVKLSEIIDMNLVEKRGQLVIEIVTRSGRTCLRKPEGVRDWFEQILENREHIQKARILQRSFSLIENSCHQDTVTLYKNCHVDAVSSLNIYGEDAVTSLKRHEKDAVTSLNSHGGNTATSLDNNGGNTNKKTNSVKFTTEQRGSKEVQFLTLQDFSTHSDRPLS